MEPFSPFRGWRPRWRRNAGSFQCCDRGRNARASGSAVLPVKGLVSPPGPSRLAEVTLGGHTVWIRTEDGRLWLAPYLAGTGLSWGVPRRRPKRAGRLLDDITTPR